MPKYRPKNICQQCGKVFLGAGLHCPTCRPSRSGGKSYAHGWRKVRERVLREAGIPKDLWSQYDVDHNPPYDPSVEPDHYLYELIPRLHADHSRKTANEDNYRVGGKFAKKRVIN